MSTEIEGNNTPAEEAFFAAIKAGRQDKVKEALEAGPQLVNAFDYSEFGGSAINLAVHRDDRPMIELLLEKGADINLESDFAPGGWTPTQLALCSGKDELADFLVAQGAAIGPHEAAGLGRIDDLQRLFDENSEVVHEGGGDGCTPLHFARTVEVADWLLEHGADIEARCEDHHSTPVDYLCTARPDVAVHLMDRGAEWNLFVAIMAGDQPRFQEALAKPDAIDMRIDETHFPPHPESGAMNILYFTAGWNSSPLHAAARANRPKFIRDLVNAGMEVGTRADYDDCTALHVAAWWDEVEVARCLIELGADIEANSGDIHCNSPAGWAIVAGSSGVLEVLIKDCKAEIRDYYLRDAKLAQQGEFRIYKASAQERYDRVVELLST